MQEKTKKIQTKEEKENQDKKMKTIEKTIKIFGGAIITILGIIFLIFCKDEKLGDAISYCVATVLLVFGLFSICLSFMFGKGIVSFDLIGGCIVCAFAILIYIEKNILETTLPILISVSLLFLSIALIVETVILYSQKTTKKAVVYTIIDALIIALGITILVLYFQNDSFGNMFINILIGISFIVAGIIYIIFTLMFAKIKNKDLVKDKKKDKKSKAKKEEPKALETVDVEAIDEKEKNSLEPIEGETEEKDIKEEKEEENKDQKEDSKEE